MIQAMNVPIPPPPRSLRRARGYYVMAMRCVVLVIVVMIGQLFLRIQLGSIRSMWLSEVVPARVTRAFAQPREHRSAPDHFLSVVYQVNGEEHSDDLRVGPQDVASHQPGDIVQVQFLPERPDAPTLYYEHYPKTFVTIGMSLFALAIVSAMLKACWDLFIPWRQHNLLCWGEATFGVIVERQQTVGKGALLTLTYEYQVPGDVDSATSPATIRAKMRMPGVDFRGCQVGDCVTVFYNRTRPRRSVIYEYADYEFVPAT